MKQMLKKAMDTDGKNWDQLLPHVLFAVREVPQASTGFSPFKLLYGRRPRGIMDLAKEAWESQPSPHRTTLDHVEHMRDGMAQVWPIVRDHLRRAQQAQARVYDRGGPAARLPTRRPGPGPGTHRRMYVFSQVAQRGVPVVPMGDDLSPAQRQDLEEIVLQHRDVFAELPGRTEVIQHDIRTAPGVKVRVPPYRIPEARRMTIQEELSQMLRLGVIEESRSAWSSPVVLVAKPDGTHRFRNDFRRLNEVSEFDAYPMPRVDELIERLGPARYLTTLDLTKGYWQVPLT